MIALICVQVGVMVGGSACGGIIYWELNWTDVLLLPSSSYRVIILPIVIMMSLLTDPLGKRCGEVEMVVAWQVYVPSDITALSISVSVYVGGDIPDIIGILVDDIIPEGPVHVMATPTDETLARSVFNSTAQVRVTLTPEAMGLSKLLVTVTMVGSDTACGMERCSIRFSSKLMILRYILKSREGHYTIQKSS